MFTVNHLAGCRLASSTRADDGIDIPSIVNWEASPPTTKVDRDHTCRTARYLDVHVKPDPALLTHSASPQRFCWLAAWLLVAIWSCANHAVAEEAEFFQQSIAPLLARHCLECHNTSLNKGGLDLSRKESAATGESGPVLMPGKSAESLLWQHVEADEMPKDRPPLTPEEKMLLRQWIDQGAVWSAESIDPLAYSSERRAGYDWWSLRPVSSPSAPAVKNAAWPHNDVDRFILARLEDLSLSPAPQADRRTLIRRLYFDLLGLPPTPDSVERFLHDESPRAYENLVDELLRSPHYGERWARHWLDVVRFGESQGYERNKIRDNAWRYRDWVVDALNRDLPYDEFVRQQIAGDVLHPGDLDALLATGYHVCGTWDQVAELEGSAMMRVAARYDHIEDLVGALGQSFLGLTINCARCHDHKFDPISQQDYYQIAALLGGVHQEEKEVTIAATRDKERESQLRRAGDELHQQLAQLETELRGKYQASDSQSGIGGLLALYRFTDAKAKVIENLAQAEPSNSLQAGQPVRFAVEQPPQQLMQTVKKSGELTVEVWVTPGKEKQSGPARIITLSKDTGQRNFTLGQDGDRFEFRLRTSQTNPNGIPALASPGAVVKPEKSHIVCTFQAGVGRMFLNGRMIGKHEVGGDLSNWDEGLRLGLGNEFTGDRPWEGEFHFAAIYSRALGDEEIQRHFETESRDVRAAESWEQILAKATDDERSRHKNLTARRQQLTDELAQVSYSGPAHVIAPRQPEVFHVFARGDFRNPLQAVSPAGLSALSRSGLSADFALPTDAPEAQRRIKLAEWLTDRRNPLTARVFVNRLWHYHFGTGLVDTPSDFGFSGGRPSHPELLDYLASRFMDGGWKVKDLQRLIVTSATYRQASQVQNEQAANIDADNRWLWRGNSRRLDGESIRDAILSVSGALNPQLGGPSYRDMKVDGGVMGTNAEFTDPTGEFSAAVNRRTIYRLWARSGNNPMLESLDCPDPSVMSPRRSRTITPVQALALLNNSFMERCAEQFATRVRAAAGESIGEQIKFAYRLALARDPSEQEQGLATDFMAGNGLEQFCLVLLNSNEFLFIN